MKRNSQLLGAMIAVLTFAAACGVLGIGGGGATRNLATSDKIPAAQGKVEVKKAESGNTMVALKVDHLAPASAVQEGASQYVVWVNPGTEQNPQPQNVGVLTVDQNRAANLNVSTAYDQFELFITAESNGQTTSPSGPRVMWTNITAPSGS